MLKVKRSFYDKYTPTTIYQEGEYIEVEDIERRKDIINRKLAVEIKDEIDEVEIKILKKLKRGAK